MLFDVKGLKDQDKAKDRELAELKGQLEEVERARTDSTKRISNLKAEIK